MCGLTGIWRPRWAEEEAAHLSAMTAALTHRGPDDGDTFVDPDAGLGLGHRRLAILDLSAEGRQPMASASGRWRVAYNGEIYNYRALCADLPGATFRGTSDTEVLLAAIEAWGLRRALDRLVGMFAFALWDGRERRLHLVRDRLGIKPLYVGALEGGGVAFASELRSLRLHPAFDDALDRESLAAFFAVNCVPGPGTIHRRAREVSPGTVLTFGAPSLAGAAPEVYWSAAGAARAARPLHVGLDEAAERVEASLREAVRDRLVADVPLGAFLSGGIDSSTVVALMAAEAPEAVRTFSIGNPDAAYDEGRAATAVAAHLGTRHRNLVVDEADALAVVPLLPAMYDQPFADSSQIPTFLVSRLAREEVTVALSGDGGDEVFGGYNRHLWGPRVWRGMRRVPVAVRRGVAGRLTAVSPEAWDVAYGALRRLPGVPEIRVFGDKVHKLATTLSAPSPDALYALLRTHWSEALVPEVRRPRLVALDPDRPLAEAMMLRDLETYLPDDILTKVDRASMAVSLEVRVPLLDHRLVELAFRLPTEVKVDGRVGKRVLRRVLGRHVPARLWDRAKMGFGVPIDRWLRGALRPWAEALLEGVETGGILDPAPIRGSWEAHLAGRGQHAHRLWDVLMFQAWYEAQRESPRALRQRTPRPAP
jgi:asparagine synthase (glutamine-hydrolysing)